LRYPYGHGITFNYQTLKLAHMTEVCISLQGDLGVGKTSLATLLHEGLPAPENDDSPIRYFHFDVSKWLVKEAGLTGRAQLGEFADELVKRHGHGYWYDLAREHYAGIRTEFPMGMVITGPRRPGEIAAMRERAGDSMLVFYLAARQTVRMRRAEDDARARELPFDPYAFRERDIRETFGLTSGGQDGINLLAVRSMADFVVNNDLALDVMRGALPRAA
jgi:hypothetical protein